MVNMDNESMGYASMWWHSIVSTEVGRCLCLVESTVHHITVCSLQASFCTSRIEIVSRQRDMTNNMEMFIYIDSSCD